MKLSRRALLCGCIFRLLGEVPMCADTLFFENFESFNVSAPIVGQDGWTSINATGSQTNSIGGISSYFSGGGRSLYIYDNNTATNVGDQRISCPFDTNITAFSHVRLRKTVPEPMNFAELRLLSQ